MGRHIPNIAHDSKAACVSRICVHGDGVPSRIGVDGLKSTSEKRDWVDRWVFMA